MSLSHRAQDSVSGRGGVTGEYYAQNHFVLPGGILTEDGHCLKVVRVRELTGADEEILADRLCQNGAQLVTRLLTHVICSVDGYQGEITEEFVGKMLIGDRDYLLLKLRQWALGDDVHQILRCPSTACGKKVDVDFLISELSIRSVDTLQPTYTYELSRPAISQVNNSRKVTLRYPTGADQEYIMQNGDTNPGVANSRLFSRIVQQIGELSKIEYHTAQSLPISTRNEISEFLQNTMPGPDLNIDIQCPYCGSDMQYLFDIHNFFLLNRH